MRKINAIAQHLRSNIQQERMSSVSIIERTSEKNIADIISNGIKKLPIGKLASDISAIIQDKTGDDMIVAITEVFPKDDSLDWGKLITAGLDDKPADFNDAFENLFKYAFGVSDEEGQAFHEAFERSFGDAPEPKKEAITRRVYRDDLPNMATGIPKIKRSGRSSNGQNYAIVSFAEMTSFGTAIQPMCTFIAFGNEWCEVIAAAEKAGEAISVNISEKREPGKNIVIKNAL